MNVRAPLLRLLVAAPILAAPRAGAEIVLLKNGEKLQGQIVITYDRGVLFREKETTPGRYYPYEEVARIATEDGLLHYLMPRGHAPKEKSRPGFFPLAKVLLPRGRRIPPIPVLELPKGTPVRVACAGASDAATIELKGGGEVRLLGIAPPPASAGKAAARRATRYLSSKVKGRELLLFPGPQGPGAGGLPQAYAVLDGALLNGEMLERGWARTDPASAPHRYGVAFDSLQRYAKNFRFGIWVEEAPAGD